MGIGDCSRVVRASFMETVVFAQSLAAGSWYDFRWRGMVCERSLGWVRGVCPKQWKGGVAIG